MTGRRLLAGVGAALVAILLLVAIGRWERDRRADEEMEGMQTVLTAVGELDSPSLRGFRVLARFDCLLYERKTNDFALELCVDDEGRVVEAIDRRGDEPQIWSLRDDPTRSDLRVDRREVNRLLLRMNVPERLLPAVGPDT
jgi:hypothetical protein